MNLIGSKTIKTKRLILRSSSMEEQKKIMGNINGSRSK